MDDKYRMIVIDDVSESVMPQIREAVAGVPNPPYSIMSNEQRFAESKYIISCGYPHEVSDSDIASWQNAVKQAIADVLGHPVSPAWTSINKGDKCTTGRDLNK